MLGREQQYNLECLAFQEKIALAELEESKAAERVKELKYEQARFNMEWAVQSCKLTEGQKS